MELLHLVRGGHELHELGEHGARAEVALGGAAEEGKELAALHPFLERADLFLARDLLPLEVALEQGVVGGGDRLQELAVVLLEACLLLGGDVGLRVVLPRLAVETGLPGEEVEDAAEVGALADRDLHRDDVRRERVADGGIGAVEARVLLVHEGDHEEDRVPPLQRLAVHPLRADLHPRGRAHGDERAVGGGEPRDRVAGEVPVARRVEEVDLDVHPFGDRASDVDGEAALHLFRRRVRERGPVADGSSSP
jgi:hypothetical protein